MKRLDGSYTSMKEQITMAKRKGNNFERIFPKLGRLALPRSEGVGRREVRGRLNTMFVYTSNLLLPHKLASNLFLFISCFVEKAASCF